jgi:hypothetical protein
VERIWRRHGVFVEIKEVGRFYDVLGISNNVNLAMRMLAKFIPFAVFRVLQYE